MKKILLLFIAIAMFSCKQNEEKINNEDASTTITKSINKDEIIFIEKKAYFKNDTTLVSGVLKELYENGQVKFEKTYNEGLLDGPRGVWYESGQKRHEGTMKEGKPSGVRKAWYENGQLKMELNYKDGKPDGTWKKFNEDGSLKEEKKYREGKVIIEKD